MGSAPQLPPSRPSLEDLLRFKRSERPAPEFWAEFDRGLRQKQLSALMKRPQGWARFRPVLLRGMRWAVPATAATAVAMVVVQIPLATSSRQTPVEVASRPVVQPVSASTSVVVEARPLLAVVQETDAHVAPSMPVAPVSVAVKAEPQVQLAEAKPEHSARSLPWSAVSVASDSGSSYRSLNTFAVQPVSVRETRRPRSSWTSRFNEVVRDLGTGQAPSNMLQFASFEMPSVEVGNTPVAASAAGAPLLASNGHLGRAPDDRDFRDLDSRFGVTGSSLSIKF